MQLLDHPPTASNTVPPQKNKHPSYVTNIQQQIMLKSIFDAPNLPWWRQDFHQRVAQLCNNAPLVVGSCLHTTRSSQGPKLISWYFRQSTTEPFHKCETAPTRSSSNLAANATSYRPTACNTPQPQNSTHPTTLNHVTNIQLSSYPFSATPDLRWGCQDFQQSSAQLSNREPLLVRSTTNIPSTCHFAKLQCGNFFQGPLEPISRPLVTLLLRSSCNRISTALDDAVACSIRTDNPFSKWNSVTGAQLEPNILHADKKACSPSISVISMLSSKNKSRNTNKVPKMYIVTAIITLTATKATELHTLLARVLSIIHPQPMSNSSVLSC